MASSERNKGRYHENWWCEWFNKAGCKAERQPLSGQLGGDFSGDIKIQTKHGLLIGESKYQSTGRGFSFLTKTHKEQPADLYLLKQKGGPHFICIEVTNPIALKLFKLLAR
jgi:hypothetical protein